MPSVALDTLQYAIVSLLFDKIGLHDPVTPLEYVLDGDFSGTYFAVVGAPKDVDEPASLVSTLPRYSRSVFVALAKSREVDVARLLSNLEDIEREKSVSLRPGEVVGGLGEAEAGFPPYAVIIMPVAVSHLLRELPDDVVLAGVQISIHFVLPLTEREVACRKAMGHDGLIDLFQREGKSLYFA